MRIRLEYGRDGLDVELPDERVVGTLAYKKVAPLSDPEAALLKVLSDPCNSPPLEQLAVGHGSVCILVCDITRPVPNQLILKPVLEALERAGIARERILILVATGLHRPNEGDELVEILGAEIANRYRIENHDGLDREQHT